MIIAALGRTKWLFDSLHKLIASGHTIGLIGTCPAAPEYGVTEDDFASLAREIGCPFFCDPAINKPEYIQMAKESRADVGISVNWLTMVGQEMIDQFPHGIINAHAGDLPRYRGNAVPVWAIMAGEKEVVITLHQMTPQLDAGPVLLKRTCMLAPDTYIFEVLKFLDENIPDMFAEAVAGLESGRIIPQPQPDDPSLSLRCFPRLPRDCRIDWRKPAEEIAHLVRASAEPFAGAFTHRGSEKLVVWRARPGRLPYPYMGCEGQVVSRSHPAGDVAVLTGDGILVLEELETAAKGRKRASEIIVSTRERLGMDLEEEIIRLRKRIEQLERSQNGGEFP